MRLTGLVLVGALLVGACASAGSGPGDDDDDDTIDAPPGTIDGPQGMCTSCNAPNVCCDFGGLSACIDPTNDMTNCGDCGNTCDPETSDRCSGGDCKCGALSPECAAGSKCCGAAGCKSILSDPSNCGDCGVSCGAGGTCTNGMCTCGGITCGPTQECCSGVCTNTASDPLNCGDCGVSCGGGTCAGSACSCSSGSCAATEACCGSSCLDICNDVANCGACGYACPGGMFDICFFGSCFSEMGSPLPQCLM
jgi:hypothetical protein